MEGRITADHSGEPYVVLPVSLYLDHFDELRQGLFGVVQLLPDGKGGWVIDVTVRSEEQEIAVSDMIDLEEEEDDA